MESVNGTCWRKKRGTQFLQAVNRIFEDWFSAARQKQKRRVHVRLTCVTVDIYYGRSMHVMDPEIEKKNIDEIGEAQQIPLGIAQSSIFGTRQFKLILLISLTELTVQIF